MKKVIPSGLDAKASEPLRVGDAKIYQKIISGGLLARDSMLLHYFIKPKKRRKNIDIVFLRCKKQKRKKEVDLDSHEIPKYGECMWKSHKQSCKEPIMFDVLVKRCGERDRDHAVITTVILIDDRDISLELCILLLRYDHIHMDSHWLLCRGEALTG